MAGDVTRVRDSALSAGIGLLNAVATPFVGSHRLRWAEHASALYGGNCYSQGFQLRLRPPQKQKELSEE